VPKITKDTTLQLLCSPLLLLGGICAGIIWHPYSSPPRILQGYICKSQHLRAQCTRGREKAKEATAPIRSFHTSPPELASSLSVGGGLAASFRLPLCLLLHHHRPTRNARPPLLRPGRPRSSAIRVASSRAPRPPRAVLGGDWPPAPWGWALAAASTWLAPRVRGVWAPTPCCGALGESVAGFDLNKA
jgi:hypothetical protein